MKKHIKSNVYWVGKSHWELRQFHGYEYSTYRGTSYNSYLIKEGKNVLIDTVFAPFAREFVNNLSEEIELSKIDYIVANHAEIDHSGALPELLKRIPGTPVFCTKEGVKSLKGHFHEDWNFQIVRTGDKVSIGNGKEIVFMQAPMLHWPDSMFCYLTGDNILFSNDAFGQHFCSEPIFNDQVDQYELFWEAMKYYANILTPFSHLVVKKIDEFIKLGLPLDMICTSHGVVWRDNPMQIVEKYMEWAGNYQENQVTLIYDTMYNGTRTIAENIAEGIALSDPGVKVKLFNASLNDKNDIITEVFKSKAIMVGSPTVNNGILSSIAGLLEMFEGLRFRNKKAGVFSSFGWHDVATDILRKWLKESGFNVIAEPLASNWHPDQEMIRQCIDYGREFARALKE